MVPLEYLSDDMLFKSHVALTNAQQLHASFEALSVRQRDRSLSWRFHPFEMLDESLSRDQLRDIKSYIRTGLYEESVCAKNVNSSLRVVDFRNRILFLWFADRQKPGTDGTVYSGQRVLSPIRSVAVESLHIFSLFGMGQRTSDIPSTGSHL